MIATEYPLYIPQFLRKIVEKTAVMMVSAPCEATRGLHPGQHSCRARRSAVDAVGATIA